MALFMLCIMRKPKSEIRMDIRIHNSSVKQVNVQLTGEMDALGCTKIRPQLETLATEHARQQVTLELSKVSFIDSSGIGAIVYLFKRLTAQGGSLRLVGAQGQPRELMELLRIDQAIEVQWDMQPAFRSVVPS